MVCELCLNKPVRRMRGEKRETGREGGWAIRLLRLKENHNAATKQMQKTSTGLVIIRD